jgi:hypothetical protein
VRVWMLLSFDSIDVVLEREIDWLWMDVPITLIV